jgi:hypothetical protein
MQLAVFITALQTTEATRFQSCISKTEILLKTTKLISIPNRHNTAIWKKVATGAKGNHLITISGHSSVSEFGMLAFFSCSF